MLAAPAEISHFPFKLLGFLVDRNRGLHILERI